MKKRHLGLELLRIIAMCMIITLHYMSKGGVIHKLSEDRSLTNHLWYLLEAFCSASVNVYVLISGYFLTSKNWHIGKVIRLWLQVWLFSVLVPIVALAIGAIGTDTINLGLIQQLVLPVTYEHYWFATAYIWMYLLAPVLSIAVEKLPKKQLEVVLVGLLLIFCGLKSVNPYLIPWDAYGCDLYWFICLFLVAGYIREYGIKWLGSIRVSALTFAGATLVTYCICCIMAAIASNTGKLWYYMDMTYSYNYVTMFVASVALFCLFLQLDMSKVNGILRSIVLRLSVATFSVYLLHDNVTIRDKWQQWLHIDKAMGQAWQPIHLLSCIIVLFLLGFIADNIWRICVAGVLSRLEKRKEA